MTTFTLQPAPPPDMAEILDRALAESEGDEKYALRQAQLGGWYLHAGQWRQLAPNVRSKVQVRKAHRQPDGRYVVTDVPVFYPNAVKPIRRADGAQVPGQYLKWTQADVRKVIANTNRMIESGGQRPGLTRIHHTPQQKALGVHITSHGSAINFREWAAKPGWMLCDLVDIEPEFAEDWMKGRMNGLSAGFNADADGLNLRVGHVARLGAESQALAHLPVTEIFAAADQFAFSADAAAFPATARHPLLTRRKANLTMKNLKNRKAAKAMLDAAYAALDANEPGADAKVGEAEAAYSAACQDTTMADADPVGAGKPGGHLAFSAEAFEADPHAAYSALVAEFTGLKGDLSAVLAENKQLKGQQGKVAFESSVRKLAESHEFSADQILAQYDALGGDEGKLGVLLDTIKLFPARTRSAADVGVVVDRTEAAKPHPDAVNKDAAKAGAAFSADEYDRASNYGIPSDEQIKWMSVADKATAHLGK